MRTSISSLLDTRLSEVLTNEFTTLSQIANNIPVYEVTILGALTTVGAG